MPKSWEILEVSPLPSFGCSEIQKSSFPECLVVSKQPSSDWNWIQMLNASAAEEESYLSLPAQIEENVW